MKYFLWCIALCVGCFSHCPSQAACQNAFTFSSVPIDKQVEVLESFFGFSLAAPSNHVAMGLRGGFEIVRVQNGKASADQTPLGLISIYGDRMGIELQLHGLWSFSKFRQQLGQQVGWTVSADAEKLVIAGKAVEDDRIHLSLTFEKKPSGRFDVNLKWELLGETSDLSETVNGINLEITSDVFDTIREMQRLGIH